MSTPHPSPDVRLALVLTAGLIAATGVRAEEVALVDGDTITATVVDASGATVVLEHPTLGTLEVERGRIATVDGAPLPPPEPVEPPPARFESRLDAAFGGSFGISDTQNFTLGVNSKRETDLNRTLLDLLYSYGASNGDRDTNQLTAGIRHDWLLPDSKWFYFAQGRYDYDEFQSWEQRVSGHGGLGYHLVDKENYDLRLRGGFGGNREFGSDDEDFTWEALLGVDIDWRVSEKQSIQVSSTLFPDLSETGEYRVISTAGWQLKLDEEKNMSLTAGLRHEYQSLVDPGIDHSDLTVFAGLGLDF